MSVARPAVATPALWHDIAPRRSPTAASDLGEDRPRSFAADLAVVGLGAAGLDAATSAARAGLDVVGVDAGPIGGGASGRNGGFLLAGAADFHHVLARRLGRAGATALYERTLVELEHQIGLTPDAVRRVGSVRLATSPDEARDCRAQAAAMRRDGLDVAEVTGPFGSGLYFPHDAAMQPYERCLALAARASAAGVRLLVNTPVTSIAGGVVSCGATRVDAPRILVAVDGGLERVVPRVRGHVRTARAQMLATAPGSVSDRDVPAPMYARYGYDYWQRLPDGRLVLGGGRDIGGEAEWTHDARVTQRVQAALEDVMVMQFGHGLRITHRWSGRLAFTADRLPVCDVVGPGLAIAGGYCGTGNVMGPLAARAALALLLGRPSADAAILTGRGAA